MFSVYISKLLGLLAVLFLANKMSSLDLGLYGYFGLAIQIISYATFGLQFYLINKCSVLGEKHYVHIFSQSILLAIILYIFISSFFLLFYIFFLDNINVFKFHEVILIIFCGFFSNLNLVLVKIGRLMLDYTSLIVEIILYPITLFFIILFKDELKFFEFLMIYIITKSVSSIILLKKSPSLSFEKKFFKINVMFTLIFSALKLLFYNSVISLFLVIYQLNVSNVLGVKSFGEFKIAFLISTVPSIIISGFEVLLYPKVFKFVSANQSDRVRLFNEYYSYVLLLLSVLIYPFLYVLDIIITKFSLDINTIVLLLILQFYYLKSYFKKIYLVTRSLEIRTASFFLTICIMPLIFSALFDYDFQILTALSIFLLFIFDFIIGKISAINFNQIDYFLLGLVPVYLFSKELSYVLTICFLVLYAFKNYQSLRIQILK